MFSRIATKVNQVNAGHIIQRNLIKAAFRNTQFSLGTKISITSKREFSKSTKEDEPIIILTPPVSSTKNEKNETQEVIQDTTQHTTQNTTIESSKENADKDSSENAKKSKKSFFRERLVIWSTLALVSTLLLAATQLPVKEMYIDWALQFKEPRQKVMLGRWNALLNQCSIAVYLQVPAYFQKFFGQEYTVHFTPLSDYLESLVLPRILGGEGNVSYDPEMQPEDFDYVTRVELHGVSGRKGILCIYRKFNEKEYLRRGGDANFDQIMENLEGLMQNFIPLIQLFPTAKLTNIQRMKVHKAMEDEIAGSLLKVRFASLFIDDPNTETSVKLILSDNRDKDIDEPVEIGFEKLGATYFEEPPKAKGWFGLW